MTTIVLECGCEMDIDKDWQNHIYSYKKGRHIEGEKKAIIIDGIMY
jgi:hypothetical protein